MQGCILGIVILSLVSLLVSADDPDVSNVDNNELEPERTSDPNSPHDVFEKAVMERLRPELKARMRTFFRQDPGTVSDAEMRNLFETAFTPEEQKEIEDIFTQVVSEQMETIMGKMEGLGSQMDQLSHMADGSSPNFDDWNEIDNDDDDFHDDDHNHDDDHDHDDDLGSAEELLNDSTPWNNNKKFVLEPADSPTGDQKEEDSHTKDGEDVNPGPAKDEF